MPISRSASPRSAAADERARATAKWGAACASCAAAKAKCIRPDDDTSTKCERCERLSKECSGQVHRPRKKRASKPSRTAQLEERLNGLVDLLRATGELPAGAADATDAASMPSMASMSSMASSMPPPLASAVSSAVPPGGPLLGGLRDLRHQTVVNASPPVIPATYNSFAPPSCICRPEAGDTATQAVETDEELLAKFRTHMQPMCPFVVLPPAPSSTSGATPISAAQLAAERPFLFLAIKTVASVHNYRSMQGLMYRVVGHVAEYMLLRAERSLDLLQGLVTVLSWYHNHCLMHAQLNNLLLLATSLLCDLGLNRPPRLAERTDLMVLNPNPPRPRTHEERRVLLGVWYLRSSIALCFMKAEPMRATPYIRQCLKELDDNHEAETDATLVALVRMQLLSDKIVAYQTAYHDDTFEDLPLTPRAPRTAYKIAFQEELTRLTDSCSEELRKHPVIDSHIATIELRLYEPPLLDLALVRKLSASLTSPTAPKMATALDTLFNACNALRSFFDRFFATPVSIFCWLPLPNYLHVVYGMTMLSRWARIIGPNPSAVMANAAAKPQPQQGRRSRSSAQKISAATRASATTTIPPDIKDPSHRFVPGQGADATAPLGPATLSAATPGVSGATSAGSIAFIPGVDSRELQRDPALLTAIAGLREHVRKQPDLALDIMAILTAVWDRFEQSNREMRTAGAARFGDFAVGRGMNLWDLTARKIAIMRYKVGRYLDGVGDETAGAPPGAAPGRSGGPAGQSPDAQPPPPNSTPGRGGVGGVGGGAGGAGGGAGSRFAGPPSMPFAAAAPQQQQPQQLSSPASLLSPTAAGLASTHTTMMDGASVAAAADSMGADLSYGLGNMEGWDSDPFWNGDLFEAGPDAGLWAENMDWVATLG